MMTCGERLQELEEMILAGWGQCKRCDLKKPLEEFPKDGRKFCKACERARNRAHYWKNPDGHRKRRAAHYVANRERELAKDAKRDKIKYGARIAVMRAIQSGRLTRPDKCGSCGGACKPDAHHRDYSKPLEVDWMCAKCHGEEHRRAN
jgi:hypothetical protein